MAPRRTALQLTPLLDLLLIVIFAQYLDVGERDRKRVADHSALQERTQQAESEVAIARIAASDARLERMAALEQLAAAERNLNTAKAQLRTSQETERILADAAAALFQIDESRLEEVLSPAGLTGSPAEVARRDEIRKRLREITSGNADAVVFHLMTHEELRKRVDIWRFHLDENGVVTLDTGTRKHRFRAEPANLLRDVGQYVDALPEPKRLVVILFTYSEKSRLITIEGIRDQLPQLMERLGQNSETRFDYADLGFGKSVNGDQTEPF